MLSRVVLIGFLGVVAFGEYSQYPQQLQYPSQAPEHLYQPPQQRGNTYPDAEAQQQLINQGAVRKYRITRRYFIPVGHSKVSYHPVPLDSPHYKSLALNKPYYSLNDIAPQPLEAVAHSSLEAPVASARYFVPTGPAKIYHRLIPAGSPEYLRVKALPSYSQETLNTLPQLPPEVAPLSNAISPQVAPRGTTRNSL
ncbi:hypothetical protein QR680_005434 [Steinernema hermaphroditum]|uniref:DUF4794 domain-containing protein n=1 Tax=Steinernema hermaphroditum TaxID=289476 RepID=A0AA39LVD8_9BILA|nr:hypothetical protein QR680_005434 [Steinernema hermaphroditum]